MSERNCRPFRRRPGIFHLDKSQALCYLIFIMSVIRNFTRRPDWCRSSDGKKMRSNRSSKIDEQNMTRANRGAAALSAWLVANGSSDDPRSDLIDVMTDLGHLAAEQGLDYQQMLAMAAEHVRAELAGEGAF